LIPKTSKIRTLIHPPINKTGPWGFFDGASQDRGFVIGAGGLLHISENRCYVFKAGLGTDYNNYTDLLALNLLLKMAIDLGISKIQFFRDSELFINWMKCICRLGNLILQPILVHLKEVESPFTSILFFHIFRELNAQADGPSKEGSIVEANSSINSDYIESSIQTKRHLLCLFWQ